MLMTDQQEHLFSDIKTFLNDNKQHMLPEKMYRLTIQKLSRECPDTIRWATASQKELIIFVRINYETGNMPFDKPTDESTLKQTIDAVSQTHKSVVTRDNNLVIKEYSHDNLAIFMQYHFLRPNFEAYERAMKGLG